MATRYIQVCCVLDCGSSSLSFVALRFNELSSGSAVPLPNTPDCRRERLESLWVLGGLGLESLEGGLTLGGGKLLIFWGSTPSGLSKETGGFVLLPTPGNCFWRKARKSSSGRAENVSGC